MINETLLKILPPSRTSSYSLNAGCSYFWFFFINKCYFSSYISRNVLGFLILSTQLSAARPCTAVAAVDPLIRSKSGFYDPFLSEIRSAEHFFCHKTKWRWWLCLCVNMEGKKNNSIKSQRCNLSPKGILVALNEPYFISYCLSFAFDKKKDVLICIILRSKSINSVNPEYNKTP